MHVRRRDDEAAHVAERVLQHREEGIDLRRQAVLFRAAWHADLLELELARRTSRYVKYGGLRFLEAAHVKDLLALLRVLDNPWDELAWGRALRLLDGVGPATATRIVDQLGVRAGADPGGAASPLAQFLAAAPSSPAGAAGAVGEMRAALEACVALPPPPGPQVGVPAPVPRSRHSPPVRPRRRPSRRSRAGRGGGGRVRQTAPGC